MSPVPAQPNGVHVRNTLHVGPIPDPETLSRYEQITPGACDRIITMAEKEQDQRHRGDRSLDLARTLGVVFGFILGLGALGLLFYLVFTGQAEDMGSIVWPMSVLIAVAIGSKILHGIKVPWGGKA